MQTDVYIFETAVIITWIASLVWVLFDCKKTEENSIVWGIIALIFGPLGLIPYLIKTKFMN